MSSDPAIGYKSAAQIVRRITESWVNSNMYCVACSSTNIEQEKPNVEAIDFTCNQCSSVYQLKSRKNWDAHRVVDAGYDAMMRSFHADSIPNLLLLHYSSTWTVKNLMVVPSFFFTRSAIQKRRPLSASARRAGWIGCNILLDEIVNEGKIWIVSNSYPISPHIVRRNFDRGRNFEGLSLSLRGWTLDVFKLIQRIEKSVFTIEDVYKYEAALSILYPNNKHIKEKIRQQLQVLRDIGYLRFIGNGLYEFCKVDENSISLTSS